MPQDKKPPAAQSARGWGKEQDHPMCNISRAGPPWHQWHGWGN